MHCTEGALCCQVAKGQRDAQGKHQQSHSTSVVVSLQSKLASMSNNFKQVLIEIIYLL